MVENVNFRIIEGEYFNDKEYEKFVEYYNDGMPYTEMMKKGMSSHKINRLLKEAVANGDVVPRKGKGKKFVFDDSTYYKFLELYSDEEWSVEEIKKELNINQYLLEKYRRQGSVEEIKKELNINQYLLEKYRRQGVIDKLITGNRQQLFYNQRVIKYYDKVVSMLKTGKGVWTISKKLDLPYTSVKRMRKKAISEGDI